MRTPARVSKQIDAPAVFWITRADDIPAARQAVHGQRHGGCGYTHVRCEGQQTGWLHLIEMIQHARLMRAEHAIPLWVSDVPRMAGEIDPRVKGHHLLDRVLQ